MALFLFTPYPSSLNEERSSSSSAVAQKVSLASVSHSSLQHGEVFAKLFKGHLGKKGMRIVMVFNVESVEDKDISFTMWDMGSQDKIWPLWHHYCQNTQESGFQSKNSVSQGNKQEHPIAMNVAEIMDELGLHSLCHRNWYIKPPAHQWSQAPISSGTRTQRPIRSRAQNACLVTTVTKQAFHQALMLPPLKQPPPRDWGTLAGLRGLGAAIFVME
ncbi:hypothetical protein QTO34_013753 [Cnephaeus nilssonii]|uniref:Uncharacterized protein n=1 Tax=Cnephaeus nilssonii TaxID=3371016 RepID=A0AA40I8J6_CNENI|nr:hypothetical protein QTO34_013753 [Eptesicus nilssonii]